MVKPASEIWRDFDPVTGAEYRPPKADIREWGTMVEQPVTTGITGYATAADLPTDPEPATGALAQVTSDPTDSNNAVWRYDGTAWVQGVDRLAPVQADVADLQVTASTLGIGDGPGDLDFGDGTAPSARLQVDADGITRVIDAAQSTQAGPDQTGAYGLDWRGKVRSWRPGDDLWDTDTTVLRRDVDGVQRVVWPPSPRRRAVVAAPLDYLTVVVGGQSNEEGQAIIPAADVGPLPDGVAYCWMGGTLRPWWGDPTVSGQTRKSSWPAMIAEIYARTGMGVILVPAARSGSSLITQWGPGSSFRGTAESRLSAAVAAAESVGLVVRPGAVVGVSAESDAVLIDDGDYTASDYTDAMLSMRMWIDGLWGAPKVPWVIRRLGGRRDNAYLTGFAAVRAAQEAITRTHDHIHMGWSGSLAMTPDGLIDGDVIHLGGDMLARAGRAYGRVIAATGILCG